jgi:hypothetical protein
MIVCWIQTDLNFLYHVPFTHNLVSQKFYVFAQSVPETKEGMYAYNYQLGQLYTLLLENS